MGTALKILKMKHPSKIIATVAGLLVWTVASASSPVITYTAPPRVIESPREIYQLPPVEMLAVVEITKTEPVASSHEIVLASVSAYTSSLDETDDTPEINARGTKPGPGSIACPSRYPFGTEVLIRDESYFCDDRMNPRYADGDYFDIWMSSKAEAIHWGRRTIEVFVVQ